MSEQEYMNHFSVRSYLGSLTPGTKLDLYYKDGTEQTVRLFGFDHGEDKNPSLYVAPGVDPTKDREIIFLHAVASISLKNVGAKE